MKLQRTQNGKTVTKNVDAKDAPAMIARGWVEAAPAPKRGRKPKKADDK